MKKIIKILIGVASIIGLTALIKHLFCKKENELIEISNTKDITEELSKELDEESNEDVIE